MSSCGITEPGDRGEREQQQEHERRPHRRELAPGPPGQRARVEVGGERGRLAVVGGPSVELRHTGTQNPSTATLQRACASRSHQPVTSSSPTTIIIAPPRRMTSTWWRRTTAKARIIRR